MNIAYGYDVYNEHMSIVRVSLIEYNGYLYTLSVLK